MHKPAFPHERALEIIRVGNGRTMPSHFEPAVLDVLKHCTTRFRDIFEAHTGIKDETQDAAILFGPDIVVLYHLAPARDLGDQELLQRLGAADG